MVFFENNGTLQHNSFSLCKVDPFYSALLQYKLIARVLTSGGPSKLLPRVSSTHIAMNTVPATQAAAKIHMQPYRPMAADTSGNAFRIQNDTTLIDVTHIVEPTARILGGITSAITTNGNGRMPIDAMNMTNERLATGTQP